MDFDNDDRPSLRNAMNRMAKKDMNAVYGITKMTNYRDKNGRIVHVGDWICFLWLVPTSSGLQRECYYYGRILKRRGKLVFKYRDDFSKPGKGFHERRLDTLNFDSTCDWEITNDSITHYGGYMPASK